MRISIATRAVALVLSAALVLAGTPLDTSARARKSDVPAMGMGGSADLRTPPHRERFSMLQYTPDPIERANRGSLKVTRPLIDYGLRPLAKGWGFIVPDAASRALDRLKYHLSFLSRWLSLLLQGRPVNAAQETGHFLTNTIIGLLGLFDPASGLGIPTYEEDVGQAFGKWGMGPGFYFFVPLLGPSSGRDFVGQIFDTVLSPATYIPGAGTVFTVNSFSLRIPQYDALVSTETDLYLMLRALWSIQRTINVEDYEIPADAWANADPEPSLGVLLFHAKDRQFVGRRDRHTVSMPRNGKELPYSVWLQDEPSPLVFLVPGIGAHRNASNSVALAELAYERGYSVAAISNPFNWEFIRFGLSASYPGYTPSDAHDLYTAMKQIRADLAERAPGSVTSTKLMGYSLGAINALFIAELDRAEGRGGLGLERVLAINPPVQLGYAASQFDGYFDAPLQWPAEERDERIRELAMKAFLVAQDALASAGDPEKAEESKQNGLPLSRTESQFLIGLSGRTTLLNALRALERNGTPVLEIRSQKDGERGTLLGPINESSFDRYAAELLVPYLMDRPDKETTEAQLRTQASLTGRQQTIESDPRIFITTNRDDFILGAEGLAWLEAHAGNRLHVFPGGGHLGNLHLPEVQEFLMDALEVPDRALAAAGSGGAAE